MHDTIGRNILVDIAYKYFPRRLVDTYSEQYENSSEFLLLKRTCEFYLKNSDPWNLLLNKVKRGFPNNQIRDVSLLSWLDRCYTLDIVLNKKKDLIRVLSLSVSLISPFYILFYIESDPKINSFVTDFDTSNYLIEHEIGIIKSILEKENLFPFPKDTLNYIIPDVAFRTIPSGRFTFFNAFFLDEIVNRC